MTTALLRLTEAANELRVSRATIYRMISAGELPTVHVGERKSTRIERTALAAYIEKHRGADRSA